ncbi:hypothetical protein FEM48_Zijuj05G0180800 [Ziziphus jujuba var. spinosa]|uniref:Uncharacterized protein n=1 Tax=Ziziphus jujuba var. spinosa TaxID=714518 RepID=A0A978VGA8_ZIZJJ|nr:hypothetical protein FEM48_Zijuj05G0179900 [Ziziphus jujuba var. spinosa]KAH7529406.1 hypothetical protein FEM48_Zijuj05G0180800 [Ziziphus jujuba var. spinosa]
MSPGSIKDIRPFKAYALLILGNQLIFLKEHQYQIKLKGLHLLRKAQNLPFQFYLLLVQKLWTLQLHISIAKALLHQLYVLLICILTVCLLLKRRMITPHQILLRKKGKDLCLSWRMYCARNSNQVPRIPCAKEEVAEMSASTSIELFGRTVSLLDPQKESPPGAEDYKLDTYLSLSGVVGNWNPLPCGAPIIQMENQKESPNSVEDKERSCSDSNEGSFGVENVGEKNIETVDSSCPEPRF